VPSGIEWMIPSSLKGRTRFQSMSAFSCLPPVQRANLEGQLRVESSPNAERTAIVL
jgi:hypothetical protein